MNSIVLDYEPITLKARTDKFKLHWAQHVRSYILSFFPIFQWITRYNTSWMLQDAIAGVTVGMVLVPQGIAYAKIANLDPQYGLYTSFVGSCLYCLFGTSKDISIGPITVVSLLVGRAITNVTTAHPDITGPEVAVFLSVIVGIITILMGMIRLGILVDFIPGPAIAGYMTGSAITISLGQWGKLTGVKINTHQSPYLIVGDFFANLSGIHVDIAFGLTGLVTLYAIKILSARFGERWPRFKKGLFYFGIMRSGTIVILGTFISFCINASLSKSPFSILKSVPAGFDAMGVPNMKLDILGEIGDVLPSIVIILVLEHVSVAKSFGRVSDYTIDPNQEILAIGVTNLVGAFFGSYPGTGAFSRTAIMSRSGAKTPLSSAFSAIIVVLALYVLTPAFYYIPEAILAAVVIHAVSDLISGPSYIKELWAASKLEFLVFAAAVLITFFDGVEDGIYVAVALSLLIMLLNIARPKVTVMARSPLDPTSNSTTVVPASNDFYSSSQHYIYFDECDPHFATHIEPLPPGVVVMRVGNALLYPNVGHVTELIIESAKARTRQGETAGENKKELLWTQTHDNSKSDHLPPLEAVVLDFTAVNRIDSTALQTLQSARELLDRYAAHPVEWHFTGITNPQVRNDLLLFGFGTLGDESPGMSHSTSDSTLYASSCVSGTTAATRPKDEDSEKVLEVTFKEAPEIIDEECQKPPPREPPHQQAYYCDPMDVENMVHPYYMEHNKFSQVIVDPHDFLPRDKHACFHWDVDSAVRSICDRWSSRRLPIRLPPSSSSSTTS
ncbi:sulfate transporter family-domain-containing protein [Fennellomyces sp. T-0311]|nr:sulfate transporter family-domain-containing protein [Fennellomyces sp. T-0311]